MNTRDPRLKALTLLSAALLIWGTSRIPVVNEYIANVRSGIETTAAQPVFAAGEGADSLDGPAVAVWSQSQAEERNDPKLLERIRQDAEKTRIPPQNARVDRIWKAIPGLNGRELDVDKTYRLSLPLPSGAPIHYVYKEVAPEISLDDLGAQPIYRGNAGKPMAAMMINVAWGDEYLPSMLETLRRENVHATFFFDGTWLSKHLEEAKTIGAAGHELSNHAYSHKNMSQLSRGKAEEEIRKTQELLEKIGVHNTLFAPPSGDFDQETVDIAHSMKLRTILWTVDTVDWQKPRPEDVVAKIAAKAEAGSMILMHPTSSSSQALPGMIKAMKKKGLVLGTVSELISQERVPELETSLGK